jgi:hypothetical protein
VSFDAVQWALAQDVGKSATKFVLVAMASHVNSESREWLCWPSYAAIARVTLQDTKTVEAAVYRLKLEQFIVDTGQRKGETGKVIVYRLNDPKSGCVTPGLQNPDASGTRPHNDPKSGGVSASGNPPEFPPNPPEFPGQSPQISGVTTPKTGVGIRNGIRNGTRKKKGEGACAPVISGVPPNLIADWLLVRKEKRAGPITESVVEILTREAAKAEISVADAVLYCCGAGWQNFNAGFYARREGIPVLARKRRSLNELDHKEGVAADGTLI